MVVIPGNNTKRYLQEPGDGHFEKRSDACTHHKDDDRVLFIKAVERHRHEQGAKTVDRRERAKEEAGSILINTRLHHNHMPDGLKHQANNATCDKYPEQIEEVEANEPLACLVTAKHGIACGLAIDHVAQAALQLALLAKRWIDGDREGDENRKLYGRSDEMRPDTAKHHIDDDLNDGDDDKRV